MLSAPSASFSPPSWTCGLVASSKATPGSRMRVPGNIIIIIKRSFLYLKGSERIDLVSSATAHSPGVQCLVRPVQGFDRQTVIIITHLQVFSLIMCVGMCMHVCVCVYVYMYMYIYNYVQRQEHICGRALYKSVIIIIIIIIVMTSPGSVFKTLLYEINFVNGRKQWCKSPGL